MMVREIGFARRVGAAGAPSSALTPRIEEKEAWKFRQIVQCPDDMVLHVRPDQRGDNGRA